MAQVAPVKTPLTPAQVRQAYIDGYQAVTGEPIPANRLAYSWAVTMLETGYGKHLYNNNFGNIKCFAQCKESGNNWSYPSAAHGDLRAHNTPAEGAAGWWHLIFGNRYKDILPLVDEGRFYNAAYLMGERGYYEANKSVYSSSIQQICEDYWQRWPADKPTPELKPQPDEPLPAKSQPTKIFPFVLGAAAGLALTMILAQRLTTR